jgi:hypothetical protein
MIERWMGELCAAPLTAETVFLRPTRRDGAIEKEVCDTLLALRGEAILFALKSQGDPQPRTGKKLTAWCGKHASRAAGQLGGALRCIKSQPFWCDHQRRGRVEFAAGALRPRHAVVILETLDPEVVLPDSIVEEYDGIALTYLSLNDALNLVRQVRAFPDLVQYFDARRALAPSVRRTIGRESLLYECFLLGEEQFQGHRSIAEVQAAVEPRMEEFRDRQAKKAYLDRFAPVVERLCDALATRGLDYAKDLDPDTLAGFDPDDRRGNYLLLQEELCDLRLVTRRELGFALFDLEHTLKHSGDPGAYRAFQAPEKPDLVYLLVSTRGLPRPAMLKSLRGMLLAAKAFYGRRRGMGILDMDGAHYEVCLIESDVMSDTEREFGQRLFGKLKDITVTLSTLPL